MKEIVIISGKGGTGKTSMVGAFSELATNHVLADCDVDAPDLHLILDPHVQSRYLFHAGHEALIRQEDCTHCGICHRYCRFGAVQEIGADTKSYIIDSIACEGCGVCADICPSKAIDFPERLSGEWYVSSTRHGPLVHARLAVGAENSGKLVSVVRRQAQQLAEEQTRDLMIVDGPPGIGCPVIASVTGASLVLIVTEPTLSGQHDMQRVAGLTRHFSIPTAVCVNKWDLNPEICREIEKKAKAMGVVPAGRISYNKSITSAQVAGQTIYEYSIPDVEREVGAIWNSILSILSESVPMRAKTAVDL
jgi:MinD superfamily P-loop ATPase